MALPILDGNQSATTLSSILTSGEHIPAHTVVSLGTQAITDISGAVSGSVVSISNFPATQTIAGTVTANLSSGTTANPIYNYILEGDNDIVIGNTNPLPISGTVTIGSALSAGTNRIGVVTIGNIQRDGDGVQSSLLTEAGSGYLLTRSVIAEGTEQIGSVTAFLSNSVTIGSLPAISGTVTANTQTQYYDPVNDINLQRALVSFIVDESTGESYAVDSANGLPISGTVTIGAGTAQIGSVTASISNSVTIASLPAISGTVTANTFALQGTAVTTSDFTSTTASTVLANFQCDKGSATIFNEGAGNLHICAGATCTTIAYQVRLSAGDYYEVPNHQTTITHSAVFATAGTARVTEVS
jgi:hypothetical protein